MKLLIKKILIMLLILLFIDTLVSSLLITGINRYSGINKNALVLCTGTSRTIRAIDEKMLEQGLGVSVAQYAHHGATVYDRLQMLKIYYKEQVQPPRIVVYEIEMSMLQDIKRSQNLYARFYPYVYYKDILEYIIISGAKWDEYVPRLFLKMMRYNDSWLIKCSILGYTNSKQKPLRGKVDLDAIQNEHVVKLSWQIDPKYLLYFEETIRLIRSNNSKLIFLYIPVINIYNNSDRINHDQMLMFFKKYAVIDKDIIVLDYNKNYEGKYELFHDLVHLNEEGRDKVTNDLIFDLKNALVDPSGSTLSSH